MKLKIIFIISVILSSGQLFGQLLSIYHGTYVNQSFDQAFAIYEVDELSEHCFLVDYENVINGLDTQIESGYGYCDDENGSKAVFYLESYKGPVEASFELMQDGDVLLYVLFPGKTERELFILMGEDGPKEMQEVIFDREDGAQLVLFDTELGDIGFTLYGVMNYACENTEISGILHPTDDTGSILIANFPSGCEIRVVLFEMGAVVQESNCSIHRDKGCGSWAGNYLFKY
jgi:hypothetical protein